MAATALLVLCACGPGEDGSAEAAELRPVASPARSAVIDSALPLEESLRRFRVGLDEPDSLRGASASRDALIARFLGALSRRDTIAIRAMLVDRAEFAFFYYPSSPFMRAPTRLAAGLAWFLLLQESQKGITRAFDRFGWTPLKYHGHHCETEPRRESDNLFWERCTVRVGIGNDTTTTRVFGAILARGSRYKFLSYGNDL